MKKILLIMIVLLGSLSSCTKHPDSPGYEYFDDMYYSPAIKAYDVDCDTHITCKEVPYGTIKYLKE
tara:strand:+ start:2930 stop:3127 length:198 start_codon:yes stop_codon:yes gene_type:complete